MNIPHISIETAHRRIRKYISETPVEFCRTLSHLKRGKIYFKMENWQKTGSFKVRGALNYMLALNDHEKKKGVITASAGNHALGVAYAAELLGIKARVVLPVNASMVKVRKLRYYGCQIIQAGQDYDEAEDMAHQIEQDVDLTFVHAFDDATIIAGQGTIGKEILQQLPETEIVIVPVGGGGLISGIASAIKKEHPGIRIIGVQSVASPAMKAALREGKVVETPIEDTVADGLAGRFVSNLTLELTRTLVDDLVLVEEKDIYKAIRFLIDEARLLVEGAGAVSVAAILTKKIDVVDKNVILLLTGRNISSELVAKILNEQHVNHS